MEARQPNIDTVNKSYQQLAEKYNQSKLPVKVQQKVDSLNTDWIKLKDLAENLEPVPADSSINEILEQGMDIFFKY